MASRQTEGSLRISGIILQEAEGLELTITSVYLVFEGASGKTIQAAFARIRGMIAPIRLLMAPQPNA